MVGEVIEIIGLQLIGLDFASFSVIFVYLMSAGLAGLFSALTNKENKLLGTVVFFFLLFMFAFILDLFTVFVIPLILVAGAVFVGVKGD